MKAVAVMFNPDVAHFGKTVESIRRSQRLTQDDLASLSGLSRFLIQKAEKSDAPKMRMKNYKKLAAGLGLGAEELDERWGHKHDTSRHGSISVHPDALVQLRALMPAMIRYIPTKRVIEDLIWYLTENKELGVKLIDDAMRHGIQTRQRESEMKIDPHRGASISGRKAASGKSPQMPPDNE